MPEMTERKFWALVDKNGPTMHLPLGTRCWLWTGAVTKKGYGHFKQGPRWLYAHRWVMGLRDPADGRQANHRCETRSCVNPGHIYIGTQSDNMHDRVAAGRNAGANHHGAKLDWDIIHRIRAATSTPGVVLAKTFGVSPALISKIRNRRIWKERASR